jgi:hypothetical protein
MFAYDNSKFYFVKIIFYFLCVFEEPNLSLSEFAPALKNHKKNLNYKKNFILYQKLGLAQEFLLDTTIYEHIVSIVQPLIRFRV